MKDDGIKIKQISLRMTQEFYDALEEEARAQMRSVNQIARMAMFAGLKEISRQDDER